MITKTGCICFVIVAVVSGVIQYLVLQQPWAESIGRGAIIGIAVAAVIMYQGRKSRSAQDHPSGNGP
jgi:hypothetical protein